MLKIVSTAEVRKDLLRELLSEAFGDQRAAFLERHGDWLHRGPQNRLAVVDGGTPVAYCAFIPVSCLVEGRKVDARWWVDLWVQPRYRRRGIERSLDEVVRAKNAWTLGFPNARAAPIHRRHGWGVVESHRVRILPLDPRRLNWLQRRSGAGRWLAATAAYVALPFAETYRRRLAGYRPRTARSLDAPNVDELARIHVDYHDRSITTWHRDADALRWRFFECPYRSQLRFYVAGPEDSPRLAVVTRELDAGGARRLRIVDVFGALHEADLLRDALRLVLRDAAKRRACQVTALATWSAVDDQLRRTGMIFGARARFCWWRPEAERIERFGERPQHWTLADADNDAGQ